MKNNITLIGMPGAGKSTLGVLLAKALGMDFIDTDILIQKNSGKLLQKMIDDDGIEAFLKAEEIVVSSLKVENSVIATGGSVVYCEKSVNALKSNGILVYLHVSIDELQSRLKDISSRGVVIKSGNDLHDLYNERLPLYKKYNDITLDCTGKTVEGGVNELVALIKNYKGF